MVAALSFASPSLSESLDEAGDALVAEMGDGAVVAVEDKVLVRVRGAHGGVPVGLISITEGRLHRGVAEVVEVCLGC